MEPEQKVNFIGVEIGGTKLQVVAGSADGSIAETLREAVPTGAVGATIQTIILKLCRHLVARHPIGAVGVGFGGPIDVNNGRIARSHHVDGWEGFELKSWLEESLQIPAAVENDANTAALAEARLGAGQNCNPVFYVTLGSGVGGGLVVDGQIYHGRTPGESEIGHLRLSPGGPIVESVCSGWAMDRRLRERANQRPNGSLAELIAGVDKGEATRLPDALAAGDPDAIAVLAETASALALGLSHVVHLAHPEIIVIGGGLSHLGDILLDPVRADLETNMMDALRPAPLITTASLADQVVPLGALLLASDCLSSTRI